MDLPNYEDISMYSLNGAEGYMDKLIEVAIKRIFWVEMGRMNRADVTTHVTTELRTMMQQFGKALHEELATGLETDDHPRRLMRQRLHDLYWAMI